MQYHLNHSKHKYVHYVVTYHFLFVFLMNAMKPLEF